MDEKPWSMMLRVMHSESKIAFYLLHLQFVLWHDKSDDSHDTTGVSYQKFNLKCSLHMFKYCQVFYLEFREVNTTLSEVVSVINEHSHLQ